MKMKLLSLAMAVLIFSTARSQSFHLGIKGGANINKLTGNHLKTNSVMGIIWVVLQKLVWAVNGLYSQKYYLTR